MNAVEAVERAAQLTAGACVEVLSTVFGGEVQSSDVGVRDGADPSFGGVEFPLLMVRIQFVEGIEGENVFLLEPEQARRLASSMFDGNAEVGAAGSELSELELSAVSEAMNQMMGAVATAMAQATDRPTDIAAPQSALVAAAADIEGLADARYTAFFTLRAEGLEAKIIQLVPESLAQTLLAAFNAAELSAELLGGGHRAKIAQLADGTLQAVARASRIAAESSAEVLSTLLGVQVSATLPQIEEAPEDPLGSLTYPLVTVEVSYVSGVAGANLFVLSPAQAKTLAAVMMGADEPDGEGLSELELSAVSEAMNQMMGAATNVLADTLSLNIEVAPPNCQLIETVEQARATFEDPAYCARYRIVSDRMTADVVQLVPADFAMHLQRAFAAAEVGRSVVAEPGRQGRDTGVEGTAEANVRATRTAVDIGQLGNVRVRLSAELGRASVAIARVANLPPGAIVELDRAPSDPVDVLINGRPYALARLVLVDGEYAVQIVSLNRPRLAAA